MCVVFVDVVLIEFSESSDSEVGLRARLAKNYYRQLDNSALPDVRSQELKFYARPVSICGK